jgi:hypothetical protein
MFDRHVITSDKFMASGAGHGWVLGMAKGWGDMTIIQFPDLARQTLLYKRCQFPYRYTAMANLVLTVQYFQPGR